MKTNSTSVELLIIVLLLAPIVYMAGIWNQLPAEIATHYDLQGNPNSWSSREKAALLLTGLSAILYFLLRFLPAFDPKGQLQTSNYQKLRLVVTGLLAAVTAWIFYVAANPSTSKLPLSMVLALVGLLIAAMGNYMTTVKTNWFVGIRTPWTLSSEVVWRKTHRLGGRLMVAGGLLSAVLAFVVPMPYKVGCVAGVILLTSLLPVIYSYVYFRQEKAHQLN